MLKLTETQWGRLQARESDHFVVAVRDQYLANRPDMTNSPGSEAVLRRMEDAYHFSMRLGFTSTPHIVRLMYLSADAPGIHNDPVVSAHLRRVGMPPEQRLDDLLAVVNRKLKEAH